MNRIKKIVRANRTLKNEHNAEVNLRFFAFLSENALFDRLQTAQGGLTAEEAKKRQEETGKNMITTGTKHTIWNRLRESFVNPFNSILLFIAGITYFTDVVLSAQADYMTVIIILSLILLSSLVAFIQNQRSDAAAAELSKMISNTSDVMRDGNWVSVPMEDVVPGDIIRLSAGDMLPADVRFLSTKDTFVAQSALTGESNPIEKFNQVPAHAKDALTDLGNLGFMGSNILSGGSIAVVLLTGNNTYFGSMAKSLSGDRAKTSFERGVGAVSSLLVRMMFVMLPIVFLINGITKGVWLEALLFAITIAVGLTPEMLPVIMTSTLAKGAVSMSKHKVIVRTLGAIQTFGEMDILCTDKTGTLTEDKIVLEKYMNLHGEDDTRVLRHAYLNSYFQTGLKNLIDLAIINRAEQSGMGDTLNGYTRVDEIPFDFSRRRMSVVLTDQNGKRQLITKGAVEEMIAISSYVEMNGQILPMSEQAKLAALKLYEKQNADGMRMIAVAQKNEVPGSGVFSVEDEKEMVLIGFVGFLDPPKESAKSAILALKGNGIRTVVLTGDSEGVAVKVCGKVGINAAQPLTGGKVDQMNDKELMVAIEQHDLFAKLSPTQKERVVKAFQTAGHTVGYMGDGINDAPALRQADIGISVDSAVDIAKETADIILLKKDLMVLEEGVIEGRKTFGNIVKYIKMAASGNFGNMISVIAASIFLPFLPMLPVQLLTQNLLCDFSQMGMPFDSVDEEYVKRPRKWETQSIKRFMALFGPLSSIFDIFVFAIMWWAMGANAPALSGLFQCGWFVFGTVSQVLIIYTIRTAKIPFLQSRPSNALLFSTVVVTIITLVVGFSGLAGGIDMLPLSVTFVPWLVLALLGYFLFAQLVKVLYIKHYGEWL